MKFHKLYPDAIDLQEVQPGLMYSDTIGECWNCKAFTHFVDIDFMAYLCSEECLKKKTTEYIAAVNGRNLDEF